MARYMALLERFPYGFEFQCCEKLSQTSQYNARKIAEKWAKERAVERQITAFVVVLYIDYFDDPTPRYQTHINITAEATMRDCIEALGETQWST